MTILPVTDRIYRGPHPITDTDWDELARHGVKTILDLERGYFEALHGRLNAEVMEGVKRGITVIHLQLGDLFAPTTAQLDCALNILRNDEHGNLYVHCKEGVDRTGEVCATYRVKAQGWSVEDAVKEMFKNGYHKVPYKFLWFPQFLEYLQE